MIEEIQLGKYIKIYRVNFKDIDNAQLSKELWYCTELFKMTNQPNPNAPGIQSEVLISSLNINLVRKKMVDLMFSLFEKPFFYGTHEWIFISENNNAYSGFHTHQDGVSVKKSKEKPNYTLTYYSKMPENLEGNDGCIIFKDKEGEEFSVLPKEGDMLVFGADILHRAATNTNSHNERIVFCTNFTFLDIDKSYNKKNKTLI
jgi:predicted 2-oxoglutarate/Fe(II)-dependent dioxygenase YbiX